MKADPNVEPEVAAVFSQLLECHKNRDVEGALGLFSPDPQVVYFSSAGGERRVGREQLREQFQQDFSQPDGPEWEEAWRSVAVAGGAALLAIEGVWVITEGDDRVRDPARMSYVLEQTDGKWLIVQAHCSAPVPGSADEGEELYTSTEDFTGLMTV
jgi:uncharacterized protein (TIGR02246 family)